MPTFTPGIVVDSDGNEQYSVDAGSFNAGNPGFDSAKFHPKQIDELTGEVTFDLPSAHDDPMVIRNEQAEEYRMLVFNEYADLGLEDALEWADNNWDESKGSEFEAAFLSDEPERMHQAIQDLLDEYELWADIPNEEKEAELTHEANLQEWFHEMPQEDLDNQLQSVIETEYSIDQAEAMAELSTEYEADSVHHSILAAGVDIAFGKADAKTVINQLAGEYGMHRVAAAYLELQETLNN